MSPDECAYELLQVMPPIVRVMRLHFRRERKDLSIPQFYALSFINFFPHSSLSQVTEHLGLSLPSTSKIVEALVTDGLVVRDYSDTDRRRSILNVTPSGKGMLDEAIKSTGMHLADHLSGLQKSDLANIMKAMKILKRAFTTEA